MLIQLWHKSLMIFNNVWMILEWNLYMVKVIGILGIIIEMDRRKSIVILTGHLAIPPSFCSLITLTLSLKTLGVLTIHI